MTAAPHLTESGLLDHLLGRDDLTIDDITDLPEDLHYELIQGRLVVSPVGNPIHQLISVRVDVAIEERSPSAFVVNVEQAVLIEPGTELHPDVLVVHAAGAHTSPVLPMDVLLVVEVLSKSTRKHDLDFKFKHYANVGIPAYWIVDPLAERVTLTQFLLGRGGVYIEKLRTDELVTVREPWEITLDLPAWTRRRDELRRWPPDVRM